MRNIKFGGLWLVLVLTMTGCSAGSDPRAAAEGFWDAMANRDIETARSYTTRASGDSLSINNNEGELQVMFGEMTEQEGVVSIATTMTQSTDGKDQTIPMQTVLVQEDNAWKVDAERTMFSVLGGAMGQMMDAMKEGMEDMGKAFQEGMQNASQPQ